MEEKNAKKIIDFVFKDVFGVESPLSVEETRRALAYDIPLPEKAKSALSGQETWGIFKPGIKVASNAELIEKSGKTDFMRIKPKKKIDSVEEIVNMYDEINYSAGERYLESQDVAESDGAYNSSGVYRSVLTNGSQNIVFCYNNYTSKYLVASRDNIACTNGIRFDQSIYCTSGYEMIWSRKCSRSLFIQSCFDLHDCMFCSQIKSKQYCIANMQFEKDEYMKIKKMVVDWLFDSLKKKANKA